MVGLPHLSYFSWHAAAFHCFNSRFPDCYSVLVCPLCLIFGEVPKSLPNFRTDLVSYWMLTFKKYTLDTGSLWDICSEGIFSQSVAYFFLYFTLPLAEQNFCWSPVFQSVLLRLVFLLSYTITLFSSSPRSVSSMLCSRHFIVLSFIFRSMSRLSTFLYVVCKIWIAPPPRSNTIYWKGSSFSTAGLFPFVRISGPYKGWSTSEFSVVVH